MMRNGDDGTTKEMNKEVQSEEENESESDGGCQYKHIYIQSYIYLS